MEFIKPIHVLCAYLTGILFILRSALVLIQHRSVHSRMNKIAPHLIDTLLLLSGFTRAITLSFNPGQQPWLATKLLLIVLYIFSGVFAFKISKTITARITAILIGIACYTGIVFLAHTKTDVFALL